MALQFLGRCLAQRHGPRDGGAGGTERVDQVGVGGSAVAMGAQQARPIGGAATEDQGRNQETARQRNHEAGSDWHRAFLFG